MATLLDLYDIRRDIAQNRQGTHLRFYNDLHDFLTALAINQSYSLSFEIKIEVRGAEIFRL